MPKQVNGQEGDLGKPLAGQELDLGRRLVLEENMRGAGEMVAGRMETGSVTRALSNVERMDNKPGSSDLNICADMTVSEGAEMHGATFSKDPYEGRRPFVCSSNTEKESEEGKKAKGSQDPSSSSESDQLLREMFLEWAKKNDKNYETEDEKNERFLIWCSTKKCIEGRKSLKPGYTPSDMNFLADRTKSEIAQMHGATCTSDLYEVSPVLDLWNTEEGLEEVAKARVEFDKWVAQHKRNYGSSEEHEKRFLAFLENMKRIDEFNKLNPGCWTEGYNVYSMDKMFGEG